MIFECENVELVSKGAGTKPEVPFTCPPKDENGEVIEDYGDYTEIKGDNICTNPLNDQIYWEWIDPLNPESSGRIFKKSYIEFIGGNWDEKLEVISCAANQDVIESSPLVLECVDITNGESGCAQTTQYCIEDNCFLIELEQKANSGDQKKITSIQYVKNPENSSTMDGNIFMNCNNGKWEFLADFKLSNYLDTYGCILNENIGPFDPVLNSQTGSSVGTIATIKLDTTTTASLFETTDFISVEGAPYECQLRCDYSLTSSSPTLEFVVDTCKATVFEVGVVPGDSGSDGYNKPDIFHKVSASSGNTEGTVINESGVYTVEGVSTTVQNQFEIIVTDEDEGMLVKFFEDTNSNGKKDEGEEYISSEGINLKKTQDIMTYDLTEGWNLVSFPVVSDKVKTASDLLVEIAGSNGYATHVATYRDGKWQLYSQRAEVSFSEYFNILPGVGYFIRVHKETTLNITGNKFEESVPLDLSIGWNLVGIVSPKTSYTADSLINKAVKSEVSADTVTKWVSGKYVNYIKEGDTAYGEDFMLFEKGGYFVRVKDKGGKLEL